MQDFKFLYLRFRVIDPIFASNLYTEFNVMFPDIGKTNMGLYPDGLVVIQISNEGSLPEWENAMKAVYEVCRPNSPALIEMGFEYGQIEYLNMEAHGSGLTPEETLLFQMLGGLTNEFKSAIMPLLSEIHTLGQKVSSLEELVASTRTHSLMNSNHIKELVACVRRLGEHTDMDADDLFPSSNETIQ